MDREKDKEQDEGLAFPGSWRGLYFFVIIWGVAQVALLYIFTLFFNKP